MPERTRIADIGLGTMGSGIARTFINAGCQMSVWNRSRGKIDALVADVFDLLKVIDGWGLCD